MDLVIQILNVFSGIVWHALGLVFIYAAVYSQRRRRASPHFGYLHAGLLCFVLAQLIRIAS